MVRAVRVAHLAIAVALAALGCNKGSAGQTATSASPSASAAPAAAASGAVRAPKNKPLAREKIDVPGGAFEAGSVPGSPGRNPELEPVAKQVDLGAYQIDRLPYPNDPGQPPLTAVTRDEAKRKCAERGQRLCTELEWERACRGPDSELYPTGAGWDPRCADEPRTCASGFDVLGLAAALREWTASDVVPEKGKRTASVRGANQKAPALEHRCAARHALDPEEKADDLGFRCCGGAPNAAVVKEPRLEQTFQKVHLTAERVEKLFAQDPHTSVIAKDIKFFREPDAANTVIERGPGDKKGFLFTVEPMIWNPVAGSEFLVFVGRSGKDTSFVVTYHVVGKDDYQLASSFIMKNEPGPVALAYSGYIRPRLHFSTCWGCPGETGKILHRDPDDVVIVQP
ncbi:MAG: SUMF1/EgtB/PvdO family nonheme iron enzyme [Polyangiaceae bacterium]|nr:SUMF1/EgtB/PvdO family nonheme iron enzyme [Polyangiaceae bacterium]